MNGRGKAPNYTLKMTRNPSAQCSHGLKQRFYSSMPPMLRTSNAQEANWKCYQLGKMGIQQLIEDVHVGIRE
mgnify:CR=1 FL=1